MNNLQRVKVIHNPNYKPSGIKSYVYLLRKCKYALVSFPPWVYFVKFRSAFQRWSSTG
jgi:hypothetical protein